jgi:hypothetical protein
LADSSRLIQGIVAPVHEGVAPVGVLHVALGLLGLVADVADDAPHVLDVVVGVLGLVLPEDLDDPAPRLVALGLAAALPNRPRLVGFEPLLT